jgi:FkbM family methyltransferase
MKLKTLKTITSHPLTEKNKLAALTRFFKRGIVMRICPYPILYPFIEPAKLLVEKGMSSADLQIFTGLYDYHEMLFLLHALKEDDLFVDVGANIGVYTLLASKVKGCRSISMEPVPATYKHFLDNIAVNQISHKVTALNIGVGEKKDELRFTKNLNSSLNHVQVDGEDSANTISIPVDSLDNLLAGENPFMLKVDVEGFETMVINGAKKVLKKESLKAIIIELNGLSDKYGFNDRDIHLAILNHGFEPYIYHPVERTFSKLESFGEANTVYIRDLDFIKERISVSPKYRVLNKEF